MSRSTLALLVGFTVALALHATLLPVAANYLAGSGRETRPNLHVEWLERPPPEALAGAAIRGVVTLTGGITADDLTLAVLLSRDRLPSADDYALASLSARGEAARAAGSPIPVEVTLPADADGPWFVLVVADPDNAVAESDERDNTAAASMWTDGGEPPGLRIVSIRSPERVIAGGTFTIHYVLANGGPGWARPGWTDRITLQPVGGTGRTSIPLLSLVRQRPLQPGAETDPGELQLALPLDLPPGEYALTVMPDPPGSEADTASLIVEPATRPDLAVIDVQWPAQVTPGRPAELTYTIVNHSPVPTGDTLWADRVYLSNDDVLDAADEPLLSQPRMIPLPGNGRYRVTGHRLTLTPGQLASSRMFLIVSTDDGRGIDEYDEDNNLAVQAFTVQSQAETREPSEVELGRADEPERVTVAWIAYDAFQDLLARESVTHQPAVQDRADPTPDAPLEPEADGATAAAAPPPSSVPVSPPSVADSPANDTEPKPTPPGDLPTPSAPPQLLNPPRDAPPTAQVTVAPSPDPPSPTPEARPGDKPTSTPRSDREAVPTLTIDADRVRPGQVLVGPGLEIKTRRPDFSAVARNIALPTNPTALITFEPDGKVSAAELTVSTGFDNIDSPILSSLYGWEATGDTLTRYAKPFQIEIRILLVDEPAPGDE